MSVLNLNSTNEREYDFLSVFLMGKKAHKEFNNISFERLSGFYLVFLICAIASTVSNLIFYPCDMTEQLWYMAFALFISVYLYFIINKRIKNSYKQFCLTRGKDSIVYTVRFGEKIVAMSDVHAPVEYDYGIVTSIKETDNLYLLRLKHNVYLLVEKNIKSNVENDNFIEYVFKKCPNIKKKKVKRIGNKQMQCKIYVGAFAALFAFNLIIALI